ncbi:restriction endonuclease subunit S [Rheinheimera oceanensis]|uniref:restriction endonuclease subunit S n=1 Tax=Rheinheimera oceanensis TaxID=2817449 RepID=UPI001BFD8F55|nr:restriction endonuclease subunit S [Rheinheimera oceanensis]
MSSEDVLISPLPFPESWRLAKLKDLTQKIGSGATPKGGQAAYLKARISFALVRSQNVYDREFSETGLAFISDLQAEALKGVWLEEEDILLNITGDGVTFGRACLVPSKVLPACVNQHVSIIRLDKSVASPGYIASYLTHPTIKSYIESFNAGGSRRAITKAHIESFVIPLPPIEIQNEIAQVLGAFDERIVLLRETNAILEAIAQALFKSWFVDFDPVHANAGAQAPSLPAEIQALFPSRLVESPQGLIPEGWEVKKCSDIIDVRDGTHASPKTSETGYPLLTSKHITSGELLFDGAYLISEADYLDISKRSKVDHLDVLITMIGTVGATAFVLNESTDFAIKNIGLFKTSKRPEFASYIYLLLSSKEMKHYLEARMAGTTQKYLSLKALREIAIIEPAKPVTQAFSEFVKPIFEKIHQNRTSVQTLSTVRDTLLPRLISGQLRLPEAEAALAEVS